MEDCSVLGRSDPMGGKTHQILACLPPRLYLCWKAFVAYFAIHHHCGMQHCLDGWGLQIGNLNVS